ncbi:hypothetical protein KY290_020780 [Solanum tuberosum]|uniref:Uncharacterized protein n=1 Tax=Solanum tuberosum TaxID=4113 RepID=A0ABQ7UZM4_SOLTU|nr:hypothetical protein KY290_020780 [Solanum tuberosum]
MPNKWNFSFDYYYAGLVALGIYVPGKYPNTYTLFVQPYIIPFLINKSENDTWHDDVFRSPHMYGYMLGQRKKALSKLKKE